MRAVRRIIIHACTLLFRMSTPPVLDDRLKSKILFLWRHDHILSFLEVSSKLCFFPSELSRPSLRHPLR